MLRLLAALGLVVALLGCASYSQVFINAEGQIMTCSATGQGVIGMAVASTAVNDCNSNMRAAGYVEIERAGAIGVVMSDSDEGDHPRIIRVVENSPAWYAGVDPGDLVVEVEGQVVRDTHDARLLLFGLAGTDVTVHFRRGEFDTTFALMRRPHRSVFGQAPALHR